MRVVFMGTPDFAVPTLNKLIENHEVVLVVSQPDKPKGRGNKMAFTPVKEVAIDKNIPVFQPTKIKETQAVEQIRKYNPDVIVVVAFGQMISKELLDMPKYGCINVHGSLLPKYRGSSPIQWSIINGDTITGVTTMNMGIGCDTGDMLLKEEMVIDDNDTYESLYDKMKYVGADLLIKTLDNIDKITPIKQNEQEATHVQMLTKQMGHINFNETSKQIYNLIRGLNPWPCAYTYYKGETIKIWNAKIVTESYTGIPGQIVDIVKNVGIIVKTLDGAISISEIQAQGGKRMNVSDYLRGHEIIINETFN